MYTVEDETFRGARAIIAALSGELSSQGASGSPHSVDLQELVRRAATAPLPEGGEADYLRAIAERLEKSFPIEELFPRRRKTGSP